MSSEDIPITILLICAGLHQSEQEICTISKNEGEMSLVVVQKRIAKVPENGLNLIEYGIF